MDKAIATLVVDLGNSETRVKTYYGKTSIGEPRCKLTLLSNRYGEVDEQDIPALKGNSEYNGENSRIFYMDKNAYCNGVVCDREYGFQAFRPTASDKKYSSITTRVTLHNAFRQGYEDIAAFTGSDIRDLDVCWNVIVLLPPEDIESLVPLVKDTDGNIIKEISGWEKMSQTIEDIREINFEMPSLRKEISINGVRVLPEGFCALLAIVYERNGVIRPDYSYLIEEDNTTIIFDIGAGTTDIVLSVGGSVISRSRFTVAIGGNNVTQNIRRYLKKKNISLKDTEVARGCETGYITIGSNRADITEQVSKVKRQVATSLIEALNQYFEQNNLSISSINNMIVCGGGAEPSSNPKIDPISRHLVDKLMERSGNNIGLVKIPEIVENGESHPMSPRLLNIIGAGIIAEVIE